MMNDFKFLSKNQHACAIHSCVSQGQIRNTYTFHNHFHGTNYTKNIPLIRSTRLTNHAKIYIFKFHSVEVFCNYINRYFQ